LKLLIGTRNLLELNIGWVFRTGETELINHTYSHIKTLLRLVHSKNDYSKSYWLSQSPWC